MEKTIVIIEDEKDIVDSLTILLEKSQFSVNSFFSAEDFYSFSECPANCLYLIAWNLPGIKGIDVIRTIRQKDKISPVFLLSAFSNSDQIIEGLQSGADDYITKPFNYEELLVRLANAHSKLSYLRKDLMNVGLKLIPEAHSVIKDGVIVGLTSREFVIFNHLYKNQQSASTREVLIDQFDKEMDMTSRNIDVHVFSLRKKMSKLNITIETVWGTGYKVTI